MKENFKREITNLFADNENHYTNITTTILSDLVAKYHIKKISDYDLFFQGIFYKILVESLKDARLSDEELRNIAHVKRLFNIQNDWLKETLDKLTTEIFKQHVTYAINDGIITNEEKSELESIRKDLHIPLDKAKEIFNTVIKDKGEEVFRNSVQRAISDGELSDSEEQNLNKIQATLQLSDSTAENIYGQEAMKIYKDYLNRAIADERLSPEEEKQLSELGAKLNVHFNLDDATKKLLDKYRLYWLIENGEIPEINSDISLQRGEKLYFKTHIDWNELRTVTQRVSYAGVSTRIKICKGVYFRTGSGVPQRLTQDVYKTIDSGEMYLTNKRIIFTGSKGNKTIRLNKILSFSPYSNGVEIGKDSGKSPFFEFSDDIELFALMLSRAINDY
ncbi:MAG: hypothetical protein IK024_11430 [Treponema sp.]|nr:hypothetical protein [Treponema sp.]